MLIIPEAHSTRHPGHRRVSRRAIWGLQAAEIPLSTIPDSGGVEERLQRDHD